LSALEAWSSSSYKWSRKQSQGHYGGLDGSETHAGQNERAAMIAVLGEL